MDKFAIAGFAGAFLEKNYTISPTALNHFISKQESVGATINDKEIAETLEIMVAQGWLEIVKSDKVNPIYKRFITPYEQKKLKEGRH